MSYVQDTIKGHHLRQHVKHHAAIYSIPEKTDSCVIINRFTQKQRFSKYPFSKTVKIVAVSYVGFPKNKDDTIGSKPLPDSVYDSGIHVINGKLNYTSLKETKTLTSEQVNRLTIILYNTDKKKPSGYLTPGHKCFIPRNALLFYDKNGKIFDYLQVCFECEGMESLSDRIWFTADCADDLGMLKQFFIGIGIKYGTINRE